jgi:hypothetical protein
LCYTGERYFYFAGYNFIGHLGFENRVYLRTGYTYFPHCADRGRLFTVQGYYSNSWPDPGCLFANYGTFCILSPISWNGIFAVRVHISLKWLTVRASGLRKCELYMLIPFADHVCVAFYLLWR